MVRSKAVISMAVAGSLVVLAGAGLFLGGLLDGLVKPRGDWPAPANDVPVVSTRGHLADGALTAGHDKYDYDLPAPLPGLTPGTIMPFDLLVVVHGFNNTPAKAAYKFSVAQESLRRNGYSGRLAGFSWDADTQHDPLAATGYHLGDTQAALNGPKLARFLLDYRAACPVSRLHVVGYSMGARVVLESLLALDEDPGLKAGTFRVDSVHLVGAAVDNEVVELGERYGQAIERRTKALVNYYSPEDNTLSAFYPFKELDRALGLSDIEHPDKRPANYESVDASSELVTFDDIGEVDPEETGDNHSGYLGSLDAAGNLRDDGVLDLITAWIRGRDDD